jgi:exopolyphosphatase / guanosine-5'-triphosphate,3'-diphosphate pyrophosphatase
MVDEKVVAFLDIGTNSVRILIIRLIQDRSWIVLTDQKMVVRLGEGEFDTHLLNPDAISRAESVIERFVHMAHTFKAEEIIAVATSALRDAQNRDECINRILIRTGVQIQIISGLEEARLIWRGVSSGIHLAEENALFLDIGGGSTEVIVGNQYEPVFLRSLKLGAIRTTQAILPAEYKKPYPNHVIDALKSHINLRIAHTVRNLRKYSFQKIYAGSGTVITLESIARQYKGTAETHVQGILTLTEIEQIIELLTSISLQERKKIEGLNPERADIIITGALILLMIIRQSRLNEIRVTERSLRDGLLNDYLSTYSDLKTGPQISVKEQSVQEVANFFRINKEHAEHVKELALMLYDSGIKIGLFRTSAYARELLAYAAYLHDIGQFISYSSHHCHSFYLIRSVPLLGFTQDELLLIALIARYHRKKGPRIKDGDFLTLNKQQQEIVKILSQMLRIAENLDRSHDARVKQAKFIYLHEKTVEIGIDCNEDYSLEWAAMDADKGIFKKIFDKELIIKAYLRGQTQMTKSEYSQGMMKF